MEKCTCSSLYSVSACVGESSRAGGGVGGGGGVERAGRGGGRWMGKWHHDGRVAGRGRLPSPGHPLL